jgi:hypothetical protein
VLILVGLAWLASNLGMEPGRLLGQLWPWPLILMALGFAVLLGRGEHRAVRGLGLILAGCLVWASREHLLPVPFWHVLAPSLLVLVGGAVIWRSFNRRDIE